MTEQIIEYLNNIMKKEQDIMSKLTEGNKLSKESAIAGFTKINLCHDIIEFIIKQQQDL